MSSPFSFDSPVIDHLIRIGAATVGLAPDMVLFVKTALSEVFKSVADAKSEEEKIAAEMVAADTLIEVLKQIKLHKDT